VINWPEATARVPADMHGCVISDTGWLIRADKPDLRTGAAPVSPVRLRASGLAVQDPISFCSTKISTSFEVSLRVSSATQPENRITSWQARRKDARTEVRRPNQMFCTSSGTPQARRGQDRLCERAAPTYHPGDIYGDHSGSILATFGHPGDKGSGVRACIGPIFLKWALSRALREW
jgi:hypothetical protein